MSTSENDHPSKKDAFESETLPLTGSTDELKRSDITRPILAFGLALLSTILYGLGNTINSLLAKDLGYKAVVAQLFGAYISFFVYHCCKLSYRKFKGSSEPYWGNYLEYTHYEPD